MINQPTKLSQMIRWRYEANERRVQRHQAYLETISELKFECRLDDTLRKYKTLHPGQDTVFGGHYDDWGT